MSELSPSTQAVLDAFNKGWDPNLPAALRAAAENFLIDWDAIQCCDFLLDMADELEAQ